MDPYAEVRSRMVEEQIRARGVSDARVLDAMRRVPRHEFVAPADRALAYADRALAIESGQAISQPYMVGVMTAALRLGDAAHVLEVGTGSGYQAAVLACIARDVITIERHAALAEQARDRLERLGYRNVRVVVGDGTRGWTEQAPYDAILVTAGAPVVPDALKQQLTDGGRLVIPVGDAMTQHLTVVTRVGDGFREESGESCVFVPLIGEAGWPDRGTGKA